MKVTFLGHSGFLVEDTGIAVIIDYYKGKIPDLTAKTIYVLSSHAHSDHYNPVIFDLMKKYEDRKVTYLLSQDIRQKLSGTDLYEKYAERIHFLDYRKSYCFEDMNVRTLKSTDEGIAFVIEFHEKRIYHAGDLHLWYWDEEGEAYQKAMKRLYEKEIERIHGLHFDLAFLLLDPRLEDHYAMGIDYFMRNTDTDLAFPMHMWEAYDLTDRLLEDPCSLPYRDRIIRIQAMGDRFEV